MMSPILGEVVRQIQNPALGAVLEWRFTAGYSDSHPQAQPCPIILLFILLPIVFHAESLHLLKSTQRRSGLRAFAAKFSTNKVYGADHLINLHHRAHAYRPLTMESLSLAVSSGLIHLSVEQAAVYPLAWTLPRRGVAKEIRAMLTGAEKLGSWCSELSLHEIASILKVRF